jgi:hypothetical protein
MLQPSSPNLIAPDRGKETDIVHHVRDNKGIQHPLLNTNKEIPHSFTILNDIPREPTYSLGSWGAQEHLYCSDNLLSMQKSSKPCLLFSLPFPIIRRHRFGRIHDVRLWFPRVMLDSITLPDNLTKGFGVLRPPKSMF